MSDGHLHIGVRMDSSGRYQAVLMRSDGRKVRVCHHTHHTQDEAIRCGEVLKLLEPSPLPPKLRQFVSGTGHDGHVVHVKRAITDAYYASCSCGWKGPRRVVKAKAEEMGRKHHDRAKGCS